MIMRTWDKTYRERGEVQTWISDLVKEAVKVMKKKKVKKVLDLGFGTGRHTIFLAEKGFGVYGIDISEKGKEITAKKAKEKGLNVHLSIADMKDMPFEDGFFDAIIASYTIEHNTLEGLKKTVSEMERVLKPGGVVAATLISNRDPRYGTGKEIEPGTCTGTTDSEEGDVPHRFSDEKETKELFKNFKLLKLYENKGFSERRKAQSAHWEIIAEKV